jgi:hypothetical protein
MLNILLSQAVALALPMSAVALGLVDIELHQDFLLVHQPITQ